MAAVDALTAPPISVEIGKLVSAVSPEEPIIDVVEEPTTATCTLTNDVGRPAAANEESNALLTWLASALKALAGDVAAIRAVMTLTPLGSDLPVGTEAVADEATLASVSTIAEMGLLGTSVDATVGTAVKPGPWPTSPPKGDSEMNVGAEPSFSEVVPEMVEEPRLPKRPLTFDAMVAVKTGTPISVVLCMPAAEIEDASKPVNTAVMLFSTMVMDDSDPYPGGTPEEGPLGYGNLVT